MQWQRMRGGQEYLDGMKHLLLLCSFFVLALVACGPDRSSPEAVVNAFCTAVAAGDAEQACSFIHPDKPALCDRVNGQLNELQSKFETGWEIRGIEPSERMNFGTRWTSMPSRTEASGTSTEPAFFLHPIVLRR